MIDSAKSILFYKDYIDELGNHVENKAQANVIYAIRFDAYKKTVTLNYPLMYLHNTSPEEPSLKAIDRLIRNLTFAEENFPVVMKYVQQNKIRPSQLLHDYYLNARINVDFDMAIL